MHVWKGGKKLEKAQKTKETHGEHAKLQTPPQRGPRWEETFLLHGISTTIVQLSVILRTIFIVVDQHTSTDTNSWGVIELKNILYFDLGVHGNTMLSLHGSNTEPKNRKLEENHET